MKFLTIGIDGLDGRIVCGSPMPFCQSLLRNGESFALNEDLFSRGWSEIASGEHARETGAFYFKPETTATYDFTQNVRLKDFEVSKKAKPLWSTLGSKNVKCGFMNLPTTFPSPKIDGFFVSGAGSGLPGTGLSTLPEGAIYPESTADILNRENYIFDLRLGTFKDGELSVFVERQVEMTEIRTNAYLACCNDIQPQFGLIAYMITKYIFNLGMYEIEGALNRPNTEYSEKQSIFMEALARLDSCVEKLFVELEPDYYMLVSDHGSVPYEQKVDLNVFLRQAGYQKKTSSVISPTKSVRKFVKKITPLALRSRVYESIPDKINRKIARHGIDLDNSNVFSARYIPGFYVNDTRFGGLVSERDRDYISTELINAFNSDENSKAHNMRALRYRDMYPDAQYAWMLPDVWVDTPEGYFCEHGVGENHSSQGRLVSENPSNTTLPPLGQIDRDMWSGIKGKTPICIADKATAARVEQDDPTNLCLVNKLITRSF